MNYPFNIKNRSRGKIIFLSLCFLSFLSSSKVFSESGRVDYDLDDDGLIEINDLADLNEIRNHLDGTALYSASTGCSEGGSGVCNGFELTTHLDFDTNQDGVMDVSDAYWNAGEGWLPLGDIDTKFSAIFEGNERVINNLMIVRTTMFTGLFGDVDGAQIRNLGLSGPLLSVAGIGDMSHFASALAGRIDNTTITKCYATGAVSTDAMIAGGLLGAASNSTVTDSYSIGSVETSLNYAGGLIGSITASTVRNSFSAVTVLGSGPSSDSVGGLVGSLGSDSEINSSFSTGKVQGHSSVGGLIGDLDNSNTINNSFSTGQVIRGDGNVSSGLLGTNASNSNMFANLYWATDSSGHVDSYDSDELNFEFSKPIISYVGLTLTALQCATQATTNSDNSSCVSNDGSAEGLQAGPATLYNNWDAAELNSVWDFGSTEQLPGLIINGVVHRDSDGDGSLDNDDAFPLVHIGNLTDTDKDGAPDECDQACINSGMTADEDDDNDGTPDSEDGAPLDARGTVDSDLDGITDHFDVDNDNDGLIEINSLSDLDEIRNNLDGASLYGSSDGCADGCNGFELTTDLDFDTNHDDLMDENDAYWNNGEGWLPIGEYNNEFTVTFEGNSHVIFNLYINRPSSSRVGLFGSIKGESDEIRAQIHNLGLSGLLMSVTGQSYLGALTGYAENITISQSYNTGSVHSAGNGQNVGGLIGRGGNFITLSDSYNAGSVLGTSSNVGGLLGLGKFDIQIINSYNLGAIQGGSTVGGLAGVLDEDRHVVDASYNLGSVLATGTNAGGLFGYVWGQAQISASFNTGSIQGGSSAGGLIGGMGEFNQVSSSFNTGSVIATTNKAGGLAGRVWRNNTFSSSFSVGSVNGTSDTGGLIGYMNGDENILINSYWATDTSGQADSIMETDVTSTEGGLTLDNLQCATQASTTNENSDCNASDFYTNWDDIELNNVWSFGSNQQLPGLVLNDVIYRDSDGNGALDDFDNDGHADVHDSDDDNDGVLDINDAFPFIALNSSDTDQDGLPDHCDQACEEAGMSADTDDDNDGILDTEDGYALIHIGQLTDTDGDGRPDSCDADCNGMSSDTDDDNDGVLDINDAFPLISLGSLTDTDQDGRPDNCDTDCNGMSSDTDDDNDGILDAMDGFPLINIGELTDTDGDGRPDNCNLDCNGMTADSDDDNDSVLDEEDAFPLDASESGDLDGDDIGDNRDNDDDNDGILDEDDNDNYADNGVPELTQVPETLLASVNSEDGKTVTLVWDEAFFNQFAAYDVADGYDLSFEATLNNEVLVLDDDNQVNLPAGRLEIQWRAKDNAGNASNAMTQIMNVYPQVSFEVTENTTGDNGIAQVVVELSGASPEYPLSIAVLAHSDLSTVTQGDFDMAFDMNAVHRVVIEESEDPEGTSLQGSLSIPVLENDDSEYNEILVLDLLGVVREGEGENLFTIDDEKNQHALTISYENLAPEIRVTLEQNGAQILLEENQIPDIQQDMGPVIIKLWVSDANFEDEHTLEWDVSSINLDAPLGDELNFDPSSLVEGEYIIAARATDSGVNALFCDIQISINLVAPAEEAPSNTGGGGPMGWVLFVIMGLIFRKQNTY